MKIVGVHIKGIHNIIDKKFVLAHDFNYLVGPNGSGKSTVFQAIQWALLGYIPGTKKTPSAIFEHCNQHIRETHKNPEMSVQVRFYNEKDDGDTEELIIVRKLAKIGSKIEETFYTYPDGYDIEKAIGNLSLPILNFNEFLSLTANKQKDLLISILPEGKESIEAREFLESSEYYSSELDDLLSEILHEYPNLDSISDIKGLNEYLKSLQSTLSAEEKRVTSTIQSLIYYDDYDGDTDLDSIQLQISNLMKLRDEALRYELQSEKYESQLEAFKQFENLADSCEDDAEYAQFAENLRKLQLRKTSFRAQLAGLQASDEALRDEMKHLEKILRMKGICPYIEDTCPEISDEYQLKSIQQEYDDTVSCRNHLYEDLLKIKNKIKEIEVDEIDIDKSQSEIRQKYSQRDNLKKLLAEYEKLEKPEYSSSEYAQKLQALNDDYVKASANKKYEELMEVVQKSKFELVPKLAYVKDMIKKTGENGLQSTIMKKPFEELQKSMNEIFISCNLSEIGVPVFKLEEKANSFSFGVNRDGFIPFEMMSSGEKCVFLLIFLVSLLSISDSEFKFVMIDDLFDHLDDERLKTVITYTEKISNGSQLLIAGVLDIKKEYIHTLNVCTDYVGGDSL